jgi:hypothetical protein
MYTDFYERDTGQQQVTTCDETHVVTTELGVLTLQSARYDNVRSNRRDLACVEMSGMFKTEDSGQTDINVVIVADLSASMKLYKKIVGDGVRRYAGEPYEYGLSTMYPAYTNLPTRMEPTLQPHSLALPIFLNAIAASTASSEPCSLRMDIMGREPHISMYSKNVFGRWSFVTR